jgi:hypothetical protein
LEVIERLFGEHAEDPVDAPRIESELGETNLQFGDVVTAKVRGCEIQQAVTESPARFDQSFPRGLIDGTREWQTARALERFDERERAVTERLVGVVRGEMTEGSEALV